MMEIVSQCVPQVIMVHQYLQQEVFSLHLNVLPVMLYAKNVKVDHQLNVLNVIQATIYNINQHLYHLAHVLRKLLTLPSSLCMYKLLLSLLMSKP